MSLKEIVSKLAQKKLSSKPRLRLNTLPQTVKAKLIDYRLDHDFKGRECLYLTLESDEGVFTQKYTSLHILALAEAFEKLGFESLEQAKNVSIIWSQKSFTIGYPRFMPVSKSDQKP